MKNKVYIISFMLLFLIYITGCSSNINQKLAGLYNCNGSMILRLNKNGSCRFTTTRSLGWDRVFKVAKFETVTSSVCNYKIEDNYIIVTHNALGYDVSNKYEISQNYEILSNVNNNNVFYKKGSQSYNEHKEELE